MDSAKREQQNKNIRQQLDTVKEILDAVDYAHCTDVQVYTNTSSISIDYKTSKDWTVHSSVRNDGTVYFEFSRRVDLDGHSKSTTYEINVMRYDHISVLEHWISWYYMDENDDKVSREVLVS